MRPPLLLVLLAVAGLAACASPGDGAPTDGPTAPPAETEATAPAPALVTAADSLAARVVEAAGGLDAWRALPLLRFDFGSARGDTAAIRARHLWEPATGRTRIEWAAGGDTTYVALLDLSTFDPDDPTGRVYLDGRSPGSALGRELVTAAYERHINDTYWLLAPLKVLDGGVRRALAPDSATAGTDVLALAFDGVGLTPGDRYWLRVNRATGRVEGWSFALQGGGTGRFAWSDVAELPTPAGPLRLATRKTADGGARAILTPVYPLAAVPDSVWTAPLPLLDRLPPAP